MTPASASAEQLSGIPVAEMSDTLAAAGLPHQALSRAFARGRFAGPAVCLSGEPSSEPGLPISVTDAAVHAGCIVVVGPGRDCPYALVGGNMISSWRRLGCAGVVVDGLIRDHDDFDGLPTMALGSTPLNSRGLWRFTSVTAPIILPGQIAPVTVHPGDWLMGNRDGTLVLPGAHLEQLIADAQEVGRIERQMRERIMAGESRETVYASHDRFGHVCRVG